MVTLSSPAATKTASASPAKKFFVDMLVRDIDLHDAILDLLDNCVDGAMRKAGPVVDGENSQPYNGCEARITFDEKQFIIEDNCGGIPIALAEQYAFRLGRADTGRDKDLPTVGVYGIGMKRAIFKLGRHAVINSQTTQGGLTVVISPAWLEDDNDWTLPLQESKHVLDKTGTKISVTDLRDGIPRIFSNETDFERTLKTAISAYYGYIIDKGFSVYVNGEEILPVKVALVTDDFQTKDGITPYIYEGKIKGVDVVVTVGLYRALPSEDEEDAAMEGRPSTEKAGWTVVCNDRVVLFADKTRVTGWGEATVPQYHTQFISIAGTVTFKSNDARMLPLTTTKRGVDGNSELYLEVKEYMREGLKLFTNFTNKWKKSSKELRAINIHATTVDPETAFARVPADRWSNVHRNDGRRYKPNLPLPSEDDPSRQIRFSRRMSEISEVATYLFDDASRSAGDVGAKCFDDILDRVKK